MSNPAQEPVADKGAVAAVSNDKQETTEESSPEVTSATDGTATGTGTGTGTSIPEVAAPTDVPPLSIDGQPKKAMKVLFLSSDTGGGHRASAQSLAGQFEILFPGSTYDLVDLATEAYLPPYNSIVSYYKHLSAHPSQWKLLYGVTNSRFMERAVDTNIKVMTVMCERSIRKKIKAYEPDVVVSVHPLQTSVPILSCAKISHETGKHLPMFTVVTDLGSAHSTWFANGVERMFVGSKQIYDLAKERGKVPDEKLVLLGLPIRHDFAVEAERMGDRFSPNGKEYQRAVRAKLGLPATDRKTLLLMGGGEGVGSLANLVDALYCELVKQGIDAVICVVCGRNDILRTSLAQRDWDKVFQKYGSRQKKTSPSRRNFFPTMPSMFADLSGCGETEISAVGCIESGGFRSLRKILSSGTIMNSDSNPVYIPSPTKAIAEEKKDDTPGIHAPATDDVESENHPTSKESRQLHYNRAASIGPIQMHETIGNVAGTGAAIATPAAADSSSVPLEPGKVDVVGLGFITNMAEYMVAADILVSKAGPGTISEAAALSLPVMLTSYLPGQEEGNVDYVVDGGFGAFCQDSDPQAVGEEVAQWLNDEEKLKAMSQAAKAKGAPYAARDIVQMIGDSTLKWREHNEHVAHPHHGFKNNHHDTEGNLAVSMVAAKNGEPSASQSLGMASTNSAVVSMTPDPVAV